MLRSGRGRWKQRVPVGALILLCLAAGAIGLSVVGDASAIDLPFRPRKAAKGPAPAKALIKGPAFGKGPAALTKGPALSKGTPALSKGAAVSNVPAAGNAAAVSNV